MKQFLQIIGLLVIVSCQSNDKQSTDGHENENLPGLIGNAPPDTTIHFLWREDRQTDSNENVVSTILINEGYTRNIPDSERAALGYVATFIGSECWWDGEATDERNNLQCKVLTALNLGYQCSDKHLGFLRSWFARDSSVLSQLEDSNCPTTPYTATIQNTFDEIDLSRRGSNLEIS
ncbi:MAG: hypothetical protein KDC80_23390, partial [Saprospiraceae bacterium]|nr:hypothetical protein [Saprospiraceae bacterium]